MKIISLVYKERPTYLTTTAERNGYPSGYTRHDFKFKLDNGQRTYPVKSIKVESEKYYAILQNGGKVGITTSEYKFMQDNGIETL